MANPPEREFNCWNCNFFQPIDAATRVDGECRRNRPDVFFKSDLNDNVTAWPTISDGVEKWCANFQRNKGRETPAIP